MTTTRIRLRRGTEAQILAVTTGLDGEPYYSTDTEKFFIADDTGIPRPAGGGGGAGTRSTVTYTTASLAAGVTEDFSLTVPEQYCILRAETDYPAWVRVYMTSAQRTADVARPVTEDPTGDHGVILETVHVAGALDLSMTPVPVGFNPIVGTTAYVALANNDTATRAITLTLEVLAVVAGPPGADGLGVPAGGTVDQVLAKVSSADNDTAWVDPSGGVDADGTMHFPYGTPPTTGTAGEVKLYADYVLVSQVPTMTSATAPSGTVSESSYYSGYPGWHAFDGDRTGTTWSTAGSGLPEWVQYQFTSGVVIKQYSMMPWTTGYTNRMPTGFILKGSNNGSTWTDLDTRTGVSGWADNVAKVFDCSNTTAYTYYRIHVTAVGSGLTVTIANIVLSAVGSDLVLKMIDNNGNKKVISIT